MLQVQDLNAWYGRSHILQGISLAVEEGEIVSIIGRGLRFFIVSWLLYKFGEPIRLFIEKNLGLLFTLFMVLLIGGFVAVRYIF